MLDNFLDLLYPKNLYCICCGKIIDESRTYRLCNECMSSVKWNTARVCEKCGRHLSDNNPQNLCNNCREHSHAFRRGFSCTEYGTHERYIVMGFKYGDKLHIGDSIGEMLADRMASALGDGLADAYDLLVPVPLSRKKEQARGYNQANIIAAHFAAKANLEPRNLIHPRHLSNKLKEPVIRIHDTSAMKGLSPAERRENVRGNFAIRASCEKLIPGSRCLIVDDIYTTGATIDEIATLLYEHGAKYVDFLTFASGSDVIQS